MEEVREIQDQLHEPALGQSPYAGYEAQTGYAPQMGSLRALGEALASARLELAVVVPTFNERSNIPVLLDRLAAVLSGIAYEVIIVDDDSPDETWATVRGIATHQRRVRVIRRVGRRGLASACLEGMMATAAPYIAVMDGDLQHDETILPRMLTAAMTDHLDVVVATRNAAGASMGEFARDRVRLSNLGLKLSHLILHAEVSDPMSGFFLVDRGFIDEVIYDTSGIGFKILLDLLASAKRPVKIAEVPYTFRTREHGESKLDLAVSLEYLYLLLDKLIGQIVPLRFALFALIGAAGVLLHLGTLGILYVQGGATFRLAQIVATGVTMTFNFLLNNLITYRDAQLRGAKLLFGLFTFYFACSLGAAINLSVSEQLLRGGLPWLIAGFAGLVLSSVWNYGVTSVITWRRARERNRNRSRSKIFHKS
jgi:dolichol-phosphate mannosyltransferase